MIQDLFQEPKIQQRKKKTVLQPQPPVLNSCSLWTLPEDSTNAGVQDLRLSLLQQSCETQEVLRVSSGSLSTTVSLATFAFGTK